MSTKKKPDNSGGVPEQILNQLSEHTVGGYVLFYFNSETGYPEVAMTHDSPAHFLGLHKHVSDWATVVDELGLDGAREDVEGAFGADEEDEE